MSEALLGLVAKWRQNATLIETAARSQEQPERDVLEQYKIATAQCADELEAVLAEHGETHRGEAVASGSRDELWLAIYAALPDATAARIEWRYTEKESAVYRAVDAIQHLSSEPRDEDAALERVRALCDESNPVLEHEGSAATYRAGYNLALHRLRAALDGPGG